MKAKESDKHGIGSPEEASVGAIDVQAKLPLGSEKLRILLTNSRLVVAHIGKRGAGALAATSLLGRLSAAFEDLFKGRAESAKRQRAETSDPKEILEADKENFDIGYKDIVSVDLDSSFPLTSITIVTREDKFRFFTTMDFDSAVELFRKVLSDKMTSPTA